MRYVAAATVVTVVTVVAVVTVMAVVAVVTVVTGAHEMEKTCSGKPTRRVLPLKSSSRLRVLSASLK